MVHDLNLAIRLRVIGGAKVKLCSMETKKAPAKKSQ